MTHDGYFLHSIKTSFIHLTYLKWCKIYKYWFGHDSTWNATFLLQDIVVAHLQTGKSWSSQLIMYLFPDTLLQLDFNNTHQLDRINEMLMNVCYMYPDTRMTPM